METKKERFKLRCAVYLMPFIGNKILLSRRFNTGWMDGNYSLIAGHLDENETVFEAIIRETFEESGMVINKNDLIPATVIHRRSNVDYVDFFFAVKKWKGVPVIVESDKCDDLRWFSLDKLPENILPYVREAIENYKNKVAIFESGWN